ncbi:MAG TPA: hypothetical protein VET48_01280 [Steroidobacteraceae bacterium]|nr:hypothetical protein [Steroidobacteraceae bacterium]
MRISILLLTLAVAASAIAEESKCQFTLTGDVSKTIQNQAKSGDPRSMGRVGASTDYWMSDKQIHDGLPAMNQALEGVSNAIRKDGVKDLSRQKVENATRDSLNSPTTASAKQATDEAMKKDPRLFLLMINCLGDDGGLSIAPVNGSKYADVKFKPGKYAIVESDKGKPGDFMVSLIHIQDAGQRVSFRTEGTGSLDLKQFDLHGVRGGFSFNAKGRGKNSPSVAVKGSFSLNCAGGDLCQK